MINRAWLTAVYRRLMTRTVRTRLRGRGASYSAVPAMVVILEPRVVPAIDLGPALIASPSATITSELKLNAADSLEPALAAGNPLLAETRSESFDLLPNPLLIDGTGHSLDHLGVESAFVGTPSNALGADLDELNDAARLAGLDVSNLTAVATQPGVTLGKPKGKSLPTNVVFVGDVTPAGNVAATNGSQPAAPLPRLLYSSTNVPVNIVDNATVTSTLTVSDSFSITDVNVQLDIDHTYDDDLSVFLIAPGGTRVELFSRVGGSGDNFVNTTLDDEAAQPIQFSNAPFTGSFVPEGALSALDGKNAQGVWTLEITDGFAGDIGQLKSWSLSFTSAPPGKLATKTLGVSSGVSWFQKQSQISTSGAEDTYAVDLVAGQRISIAAQTPESGGLRFGNATQVAIPDTQTAVNSAITVSSSTTIQDVDVRVLINHFDDADLDLFLVAPDGSRVELSTDNGGSGNHYYYTRFDDEAVVSISAATATAPFGGRYRPEAALSSLDGKNTAGTWRLEVTDDTGGNAIGSEALLYWELAFNAGLDPAIRIFGSGGELAFNDAALPGLADAAIVDAVVPTTGTYFVQVRSFNSTVGAYSLEGGIYNAAVPSESGTTTNLDPLRVNGNVAILGHGDGLTESDVYTATLNAGESIVIAATTPGGFYAPRVTVAGPNGFTATNSGSGPGLDSVVRFTVPTTGVYTTTVDYPFATNFLDAVSTGSYALTLAVVDNAANNSIASARPISSFAYHDILTTTSQQGFPGEQGQWHAQIDSTSDLDVFYVGNLKRDQLVDFIALREGGSQVFAGMLLANSAGQVIAGSNPLRSGAYTGASYFETRIAQADDYYLVLYGAETVPGGPTRSVGNYLLAYDNYGVIEDAYEENDSQAQVDASSPGAVNSPNLGQVGAVTAIDDLILGADGEDWFRFQTATAGYQGDYARILFQESQGDLDLELYDASGKRLSSSNSTHDNELISLQGLVAGTYYVRVHGYNGATNPDYGLRIQTQTPTHRLLSAPFTTDTQYNFRYVLGANTVSTTQALALGENELIVSAPSGGASPFEIIFDVNRVTTLADQTRTEYDSLGNASRQIDALGNETRIQYDGLNRKVSEVSTDGKGFAQYTYDANNNVTSMLDASGLTTYTYDELNRPTQITLPNGQGTVKYEYDLANRVTKLTYPDNTVVQNRYDAAGRLKTVTSGSEVTSYTYFADGQLHTTTLPNGIVATNTYDDHGRLTDLVYTKSSGALVTGFHYVLDANGNRTTMEIRRANTGTPDPNDFFLSVYRYAYDSLDRLIRAEYPDGSVVTYAYDAVGNRSSMTTDPDGPGAQPATVENYAYGQDNRLLRITDGGGAVKKEFFYDPRGNLSQMVTPTATTRYGYDYRNRLISVEDATNRIEYVYDGNGDRVAKIVNGVRTNYVNDPNRDFTQVLAELDGNGTVRASYKYGLNRISGLLPGEVNPVIYISDALGSSTDLTAADGTVRQSYSYDAFGAPRPIDAGGVAGTLANEFRFTGERVDSETTQIYLRARYYDATTGRFLAKDPSGFIDGSNLYQYAHDNPTTLSDPSGRVVWWVPGAVGATVGTVSYFASSLLTGSRITARGWAGAATEGFVTAYTPSRWVRGLVSGYTTYMSGGSVGESLIAGGISTLTGVSAGGRFAQNWTNTRTYLGGINYAGGSRFISNLASSIGTSVLGTSLSRGGVLLNRAVDFVGDLSSITGATVDPVTGQVVLLGTQDAGGTVPDLRLDDFVTAVRAVFASAEDPGVTLDPQAGHESDPSFAQLAHLFGGLDDTDMGWVLLEADRVMKTLAAERDNVSGASVTSGVSGYKSMLQRWLDRGPSGNSQSSRFWFVPTDVKLVRSPSGNSFVFDQTAVKLLTEDTLVGNGAVDPDAKAFADWFTANYDAIARENYTVYDYSRETVGGEAPSQLRVFQRLEQVAKAIAFARFLRDNDIPIDFSWIDNYEVPVRNTPLEAKTVQNSRTKPVSGGTFTITITGGVTMNLPNAYLPDSTGSASNLGNSALAARPDELTQKWDVGAGQKAVALSLDSGHVDGAQTRDDTDLTYKSPGDMPLALSRFTTSTKPTAGPFGYGWEFVPYDMDFAMPEFFSSSRSPLTSLNGLHEGEVRIVDRMTGQTRTFQSSFATDRTNGFAYGGLNANGVPIFIAGGSEQPDGSTLTQEAGTLKYTLTSPDGTKMVFDPRGHLLSMIDVHNRAVTYGYTGNLVTSIGDSAGQTISLTYNGQGRVTRATGLGGEVVDYAYTAAGDLASATRVRQGQSMVFSYEYDADHHITMAKMPDRVVESTSVSDLLGRATTRGDARNNVFDSDYDPTTRTTVTTDMKNGTTVVTQTDSLGRARLVRNQLGEETRYFYVGTNRQPAITQMPDPNRPLIFNSYDTNGNVTEIGDVARGGDANSDGLDDNPIKMEYDANNNLLKVTDARGLIALYTYNSSNQRTSERRAVGTPLESTRTWQYDPVTGDLLQETDASGVVTEYEYDVLGNMIRETVAPGTPAESTTRHTYDAFSRRISTIDGMGRVTTFEYDGRDNLVKTTRRGSADLVATSTYDATTGRKLTDADYNGNTTTFFYNATTGDLIDVTEGGNQTKYVYDRFGNIDHLIDPVGNVTDFDYDTLQRLTHTTSLGSTPRIVSATGTPNDITIGFSEAMNAAVVDNGTDVVVRNSQGQAIRGTISFSANNQTLIWTAAGGSLAKDTYTLNLKAGNASEFVTSAGVLLDGEYFGALPSGDNQAGGDFAFSWFVDDHGNDAGHTTALVVPANAPGELEFAGDKDWFRFDAVAGNRFTFEVEAGTGAGVLSDSVLRLYGSDGVTLLEMNDDKNEAAGQYGSLINWQAPQTGTYFLEVRGYGETRTGTYQLNAAVLADDHSDQTASATAITVPSLAAGNLDVRSDIDMFSFQAQAGKQYRIASLLGTLQDSYLTLYDKNGTTVLATNDDYAGGKAARLDWTAPAGGDGTYYIAVSSYNNQYSGTYELTVSIDDHGDNSGLATAVQNVSVTAGNLEVKADADWFSFTAAAGENYRLDTTLGTLPDSFLTLYGSNGTTAIAANDNYQGPASSLFWTAQASGTYFARVTGFSGTGTYNFKVTHLIDDHGNNAAGATHVAIPSTTDGDLAMPGDADWFSFDVTQGLSYRVEALLDGLADSVLTLYDINGTSQLAQNDDFRGPGSRIDFTAAGTGTYYAAVTSRGGTYVGTYDFNVLQLETVSPTGALAGPLDGSVIRVDPGYVDILWSDGSGSGIDPITIDSTDIQVAGATTTSVEDRGGGIWRYHYSGALQSGAIQVTFRANHVADLHGNWNSDATQSFTFAPPTITVSIANAAIRETAGIGATTATIRRINVDDLSADLTVTLTSSDAGEATLVQSVTIPANQDSVTVNIDAVDDTQADGTQVVTISASAAGFIGGDANVNVTDHGDLSIVLAAGSVFENAGANATTATLTRSDGDDLSAALQVTLDSSDSSEAAIPSTVTIAANQISVTFAVDAVDDNVYDGTQSVTIGASASEHNAGTATLDVVDYEVTPPSLHSRPGAAATLFLDFDGYFQAAWTNFTNIVTPVFDRDGLPNLFGASELAAITEIWQRVAEDFIPFNIDVTTVNPDDFSNGVGLRVAIGGSSADWYEPQGGQSAGGVALLNSFTNGDPNVVYVFPAQLSDVARYIAEASSHEAGHAFGLRHQSRYDVNANKIEEYNPGNANWAPIMGVSYYAARSTWYNGPDSVSAASLQDDLAIISGAVNGFGYRPDDRGNTFNSATPLTGPGFQKTGSGIIEKTSDADYFSFITGGGEITVSVAVADVGANLDATLELRSATDELIASADPGNSLGATITTTVATGEYRVVVRSHGTYGDVGQYTVTASVLNALPTISAFDTTVTYATNGSTVVLDQNATVTDLDSTRFAGAVLTVSLTANSEANDRLEIRPVTRLIGVSGTDVTYRGTIIGALAGGIGTADLVITFNGNATESAVQTVLRSVTYRSVSANPSMADRTVRVTLTDGGGGTSNPPTKTINIAAGPGAASLANVLPAALLSATSVAENPAGVTLVRPLSADDSGYSLAFIETPITGAVDTGDDQNREYLLSFVNAEDPQRLKRRRRSR